jgi:hypothetical protein
MSGVFRVPAGGIDGVNIFYTTPSAYVVGSLEVFVDGNIKTDTSGFTDGYDELSATLFRMRTAPLPGSFLQVRYTPQTTVTQSDAWASFNGTTTTAILDEIASNGTVHNINGNYSYAFLVRATAGSSGTLWHCASSGSSAPSLRIDDVSDKARYRLRRANSTLAADELTTPIALDSDTHLILWSSRDDLFPNPDATLLSKVDANTVEDYGIASEGRQAQGVNWPPNLIRLGHASYAGEVGWMAVGGQDNPAPTAGDILAGTGGADIVAAYGAGGRRALSAAFALALGTQPLFAGVLDGVSSPDYGPAPVWVDVSYTPVEV